MIVRKEKKKTHVIFKYLFSSTKYFIKGKFKQAKILYIALNKLIRFNPKIEYPIIN